MIGVKTMDETKDIAIETVYEFREINSTDIFPMLKIISKIGVNKFSACFDSEFVKNLITKTKEEEKSEEEQGGIVGLAATLEVAQIICENLPDCQKEIYEFLERVSNLDQKALHKLSPAVFITMLIDLFKKEEFADFIKVVSGFVK